MDNQVSPRRRQKTKQRQEKAQERQIPVLFTPLFLQKISLRIFILVVVGLLSFTMKVVLCTLISLCAACQTLG
ncbi:hypothetical protein L9W92_01830 [Pelotomaculum terephthalicicum JT]|uniref:hypothetical protein n=1 Tax=Pelotomaculum terephthalicicum TaxID=206393 RepID=UPI001F04F537|nr:hypothetical protein [Pelotomaculum terephthalicicum]MCG9966798.1 hypothetical protein [Pelotomaculum terephthalicicum JT]